jgi:hypothetical protein
MAKFLREPPGGPRSGGEAMSEAKPVRWRPCEAGARPNKYSIKLTFKTNQFFTKIAIKQHYTNVFIILYNIFLENLKILWKKSVKLLPLYRIKCR